MSNTKLGRPVVVGRASPASNIGPCYVYGDETTNDTDLENNLEEDCDRLGMGLKCIRTHQRWDHFPHLDPEHFNQFYRQLERAQGNQGIYFAGEVANFSTVEHVVRYSNALVERYF